MAVIGEQREAMSRKEEFTTLVQVGEACWFGVLPDEDGWRCLTCGGIGYEKDLFEAAMACGKEEYKAALHGEWKTKGTKRVAPSPFSFPSFIFSP